MTKTRAPRSWVCVVSEAPPLPPACSRAYRVDDGKVSSSRGQSCCQHGQELQAIQLSTLIIVMEGKEVEEN